MSSNLSPQDEADTAELERLILEAVSKLIEHCDSCQLFVTKQLENGKGETYSRVLGRGNSYANYGAIREWVNEEEGRHAQRYKGDEED